MSFADFVPFNDDILGNHREISLVDFDGHYDISRLNLSAVLLFQAQAQGDIPAAEQFGKLLPGFIGDLA